MTLVTRCPACATMFKVSPDQLKIADGWVRCGRCSEVFEASVVPAPAAPPAGLILDAGAPSAPHQPAPMPAPQWPETPSFSVFPQQGLTEKSLDLPDYAPSPKLDFAPFFEDAPLPRPKAAPQAPATADGSAWQAAPQEAVKMQPDALPARFASGMSAWQEPERIEPTFSDAALVFKSDSVPLVDATGFSAHAPDAPLATEKLPESAPELSFMRDAQPASFWTPARQRTALVSLFTLLLLALALQWTVRQRDVLAAQQPRLVPWLEALCRPLGCEIRPLRRIESVKVENAKFSKSGARAYRLTFVLKNTGDAAVEIPALEVTLTNSQHQPLVRRVLLPAQFGVTASMLQAHSEVAGVVALTLATEKDRAAALPVTGYRILAFYP